jgi:hypothetical protein
MTISVSAHALQASIQKYNRRENAIDTMHQVIIERQIEGVATGWFVLRCTQSPLSLLKIDSAQMIKPVDAYNKYPSGEDIFCENCE